MEGSECDADKLDDLSTVEISSEIWTGEVFVSLHPMLGWIIADHRIQPY